MRYVPISLCIHVCMYYQDAIMASLRALLGKQSYADCDFPFMGSVSVSSLESGWLDDGAFPTRSPKWPETTDENGDWAIETYALVDDDGKILYVFGPEEPLEMDESQIFSRLCRDKTDIFPDGADDGSGPGDSNAGEGVA